MHTIFRNISYLVVLVWMLASSAHVLAVPPKVIVIDPGHGGKDPGATFKGVQEKDITLAVGLLVAQQLKAELPNVTIELTRDQDVYNHVTEKAEIANNLNGELFVSIHVNSAKTSSRLYKTVKKAYYVTENGKKVKKHKNVRQYYTVNTYNNIAEGTEIYIWASDRNDNKSEAINSSYERNTEDDEVEGIPDLDSPEAKLLSQMYAQQFFKSSFKLASFLDTEFKNINRPTRGVKQRNNKGIWVLQATAMPAVLVELGYLTNKNEADYMTSPEGQQELASAIVKAIVAFAKNG